MNAKAGSVRKRGTSGDCTEREPSGHAEKGQRALQIGWASRFPCGRGTRQCHGTRVWGLSMAERQQQNGERRGESRWQTASSKRAGRGPTGRAEPEIGREESTLRRIRVTAEGTLAVKREIIKPSSSKSAPGHGEGKKWMRGKRKRSRARGPEIAKNEQYSRVTPDPARTQNGHETQIEER